jgi:hypothetical protein
MLILPENAAKKEHEAAKAGLVNRFNAQMEKIINENQKLDRYYILGKVRFPQEYDGRVGHVFLEACLEKPPVVTESFVYEVDNRKGCKTLLWVMHPDKTLALPTINKRIQAKGRK